MKDILLKLDITAKLNSDKQPIIWQDCANTISSLQNINFSYQDHVIHTIVLNCAGEMSHRSCMALLVQDFAYATREECK